MDRLGWKLLPRPTDPWRLDPWYRGGPRSPTHRCSSSEVWDEPQHCCHQQGDLNFSTTPGCTQPRRRHGGAANLGAGHSGSKRLGPPLSRRKGKHPKQLATNTTVKKPGFSSSSETEGTRSPALCCPSKWAGIRPLSTSSFPWTHAQK